MPYVTCRRKATSLTLSRVMGVADAICTKRKIVTIVNRRQQIGGEAKSLFVRPEGDAGKSRGAGDGCKKTPRGRGQGCLGHKLH